MENQNNNNEKVNWRAVSRYVDIDTGEEITKEQSKTEYMIVNRKIKRYVLKMVGKIEITNECKINPQRRFNF